MPSTSLAPDTEAATKPATESEALDSEASLDPMDWEHLRSLAHQMLDTMLDRQQSIREEPAWRPFPDELEEGLRGPLPERGAGLEATWESFQHLILPYRTGNLHPRWWGWVGGTGSPSGMLAEMLTGGMNSVAGLFDDSAARVESLVIEWMRDGLGLPNGTSGVITSGGSVANLIGLAVGRDARAGVDLPVRGLAGCARRPVFYASEQVHSSVKKAAQILGLGRSALRLVQVDEHFRIRTDALSAAIAADREDGLLPFAVVGNAGTVNTGAVDDLVALSRVARRESLWLHVDGAFGAVARLSQRLAPRLEGLDLADSVAFDFHKWLYVPYEAGCVMVRDPDLHRETFRVNADYLDPLPRGIGAQRDSTDLRSLQLSRGFKALKVWWLLHEHGRETFARLIERNVAQAEYLAGRIDRSTDLELLAGTDLNVICYRYRPTDLDEATLDALNREILMRLQEQGWAVPSHTLIHRKFAIRVAITNQRSRRADFDLLLEKTAELGKVLLAERQPGGRTAGSPATS